MTSAVYIDDSVNVWQRDQCFVRKPLHVIITCEHGGNRVPTAYRSLFMSEQAQAILLTHRGWDIGALELSRRIAKQVRAPLRASTITRLLVDLNRSLGNRQLFSEFTRGIERPARRAIIATFYEPHRALVQHEAENAVKRKRFVLHIGVHTFTPLFDGERRNADVGILFDPKSSSETHVARAWQSDLQRLAPSLMIRRNYPYKGKADGFTTAMRRQFGSARYAGIELEVNQRFAQGERRQWLALQKVIASSLQQTIEQLRG